MATSGRPDANAPTASDVAGRIRAAGFVRVVSGATGDALAATGTLLAGLAAAGVPHQTAVAPAPEPATRATEADLTVTVGRPDLAADQDGNVDEEASSAPAIEVGDDGDGALSPRAYAIAGDLGDPGPVLALAGTIAAGVEPAGAVVEDAVATGLERRPGLAIPVDDPVDGLVHSTLVHGPFSADEAAAQDAVTAVGYPDDVEPDEDDRRRLASRVALAVTAAPGTPGAAARVIDRALRPYDGGPFETVGGFADVLSALAAVDPGFGLSLVARCGDGTAPPETVEAALDRWRTHGRTAHEAVRDAEPSRHDGLLVVQVDADAPLETVARLLATFRSPEPVVIAVRDGEAVVATRESDPSTHLGDAIAEAAAAADGTGAGTPTVGRATFDGDREAFLAAVREAL